MHSVVEKKAEINRVMCHTQNFGTKLHVPIPPSQWYLISLSLDSMKQRQTELSQKETTDNYNG